MNARPSRAREFNCGAIFESAITRKLGPALAQTPVAGKASQIAHAVAAGGAGKVVASVPPGQRLQASAAIHSAFTSAMNEILLVAAIIAFAGAALGLLLVRGSDFVTHGAPEPVPAGAR